MYQGSTVADFGPVKEVQNEKYRVPNYKPNTKEIFVLGGLSPFRKYKFSIEYSNVAETCFGRSLKSEPLEVSTTRMTAPGTASKPNLISVTGGMIEIKMETPKDLGGYSGGVTGYRVLSQVSGQNYIVAYDGANKKSTKVLLNGLTYNTNYKFVSLGMSYVDYPDFAIGLKPSVTPFAVAETLAPSTTKKSIKQFINVPVNKLRLSSFEFGADQDRRLRVEKLWSSDLIEKDGAMVSAKYQHFYENMKSLDGATIEFWIRMIQRPDEIKNEFMFLRLEDRSQQNKIEISLIHDTLEWKKYGSTVKDQHIVKGPQLKIFVSRREAEGPAGLSASSIFSAYDNHPIKGNGFPLNEWIHVAISSERIVDDITRRDGSNPQYRQNIGSLYLNGVLSTDGSFPHLSRTLYVNNWVGHENVIFDELRIYNEIRSETAIRDLMTRHIQVEQRSLALSLVFYLGFDDAVESLATGLSKVRSVSSDVASGKESLYVRSKTNNNNFLDYSSKHEAWIYKKNHELGTFMNTKFTRNSGITVALTVRTYSSVSPAMKLMFTDDTEQDLGVDCETNATYYMQRKDSNEGIQEPAFSTCRMEYQSETKLCTESKDNQKKNEREWIVDISYTSITSLAGVVVTQGSSTGTLKTKINGATTSLVVIAAVNVNFVTNLPIHIGTGATKTTVAQENILFVNKQTQGEWCTDLRWRYHHRGRAIYSFTVLPATIETANMFVKKTYPGKYCYDSSFIDHVPSIVTVGDAAFKCFNIFGCGLFQMNKNNPTTYQTWSNKKICTLSGVRDSRDVAIATTNLYTLNLAAIDQIYVAPYSLLGLWTFEEGYGTYTSDLSYGLEEKLNVDWEHSDWYYDVDQGITLQMDGYSSAINNITGLDMRRSEWSSSFWIKTQKVVGRASGNVSLLAQNDGLLYNDQNGVLHLSFASLGTSDAGLDISQCSKVNLDAWVHIAISYTIIPRTVTLYTNGKPCGSSIKIPWSNDFNVNEMYNGGNIDFIPSKSASKAMYFGDSSQSHLPQIPGFRGLISHWSIWTSSLNDKQIRNIYEGYYLGKAKIVASLSTGALSWINSTRGDGLPSEILYLTTNEFPTVPTPPRQIEASKITGGAIHLQVVQPVDTGGVDILGYNIYYTNRFGVIQIKTPDKMLPFLTVPFHTIGQLKSNTMYNFIAEVYAGVRLNKIKILKLSIDASLGLEWKRAAVYLDPTVDVLTYTHYIEVGKHLIITDHKESKLIGAYEIQKVVPYESEENPGYFVIEYPQQLIDSKNFNDEGCFITFCLKSKVTEDVWSFSTNEHPTSPGPPGQPWAVLASDESMSIKFKQVMDDGGDQISKYNLYMRDAIVKGIYVKVYSGPYQETIRVGRRQFPGMTENRQFQLKALAYNSAGAGAYSKMGIASTTDLCDLSYSCAGGNAIVLDWSACAKNTKGGNDPDADPDAESGTNSEIQYRLIELVYNKDLRDKELDVTLNEQNTKILYKGTSLRFTRWDLKKDTVVRRYRVEIFMMQKATGKFENSDIYSSYLRITPSGTNRGIDLVDSLVHAGTLVCKKSSETVGSGTYNAHTSKREWTFAPQTDGGTSIPHQGILLYFNSFDLECDTDSIKIREQSTNRVLWSGGCHRGQPFYIFSRKINEPIVLSLSSDAHFSGTGFEVKYEAIVTGHPGVDESEDGFGTFVNGSSISLNACPARFGSNGGNGICSGHGECVRTPWDISTEIDPITGDSIITEIETYQPWKCKCQDRYFGEACSFEGFCTKDETDNTIPYDVTANTFVKSVCKTPDAVVSVWPYGRDEDDGVSGGTASVGTTVFTTDVTVEGASVMQSPKPVRSVRRAMEIGFSTRRRRRRSLLASTVSTEPLNILLYPGKYLGTDVCNTVAAVGKSIRIGSLNGRIRTKIDCEATGNFLTIEGSGTSVEIVDITLAGGAVVSTDNSNSNSNSKNFIIGSLLHVSSEAIFNGIDLQIQQSKNAPALVVTGLNTRATFNGLTMSSLSDGAVRVEKGAFVEIIDVLFSSNVADNGGCVHADGLGTKVVLKQVESTGSQVNEFGGFVCAENGSEVEIYDAKIAKASTKKKGGVIAILSGSTVTAFDLRATESSAEEAGAVIHAQGFGSVGFLSNSTVVDASSNYGGVFSAENGGKITMKHSTTNQINARKNGGLMYANGKNSKITLQYCQGMALIAKHSGGLLHAENQSSILIEDSTFMNLLANKGGTVSLSDQGTMASIKRSTIQQTTAHSLGGGLHLNKQAILHLKNTKWKNLEVQGEQGGAGMYLENGAQVQGGSISESNIFTQLKAHVGAGIVSNGKNVVATGLSFNQLHAERGAGIYVLQNHVEKVENVEATNLKLSNIDIFKANATLSGAGIYSFHSNSIVEINDIQFNQIWSKKGGVAHIFNSSLSILNLRVEHSQVETIGGLALLEESATLLVDGGSMNNISSLQNGGGLYITDESTATIKNMHANSISTDSKGGFALVRKQSQLHLSSTTIHDCFARKSGGTIHAQEASIITMLKTLTTKSYSDGVGGTVALYESSRLLGDGATIFRNTTAAEKGGGIYLDGTNVTVQGIEIDGASSLLGAGLYADGTKTKLQNMKIKNCKATNGGGGLYATAGAQLNILETYIDTSRSTIGGGLYVTENSIVHGERVFLRNNTADRGGGSMVDKKSTIYLTASIIYGNFAKEGAGICLTEGGVGDFKENTQFIRNKASKQGGGLMVVTESSARLQNSEMYENSGFYGGAIYVDGCDIYLITVKINYNTVANGGYGGGLFIAKNGNAQVLKGTVFEGNSATKGGAGYIEYGSLFYLDNSKLHANKAVYDGGGLFVNDALALLYKSTISNNEAVDEGGGVNVQNGGNLTATETKFFGNNVGGQEETGSGIGSVAVLGRSTSVQILECDFYDNKALNIGGLYATEAKVHIEASRFYDNEAKEGAGLVLDRTSNGMSYISNSKFYRNKAREDGGGAIIRGEVKAKIENCEFGPDNEAGSVGGGLLIDKLAKVWMKDVKIYRNRAVSGAGIRISGKGQLVMRGKCEINNNVGVEGAGISAVDKSWLNIQDASFKQNNASMRGGGIMMTHTNCPKETKQIGKLVATATLYVPCIQIDTTHFEENIAGAGGGFFWRYREPTVKKGCMFVGVSGIVILPGNQLYDAADALDQRIMDTMDCIDDKFCNLVSDLKEDCSSSESRDFKCNNCNYGPELLNQPTGAGTNAMGTRVIYFPDQGVETGLQLFGDGVTIQIEVTDRYGLRSTLDDTTKCSISKDPLEVGDLGIDEGVAQSKRGVVSFNRNGGVRFLGDGDITYKIVMDCLIDGVIDMSYDTTVTVQWCEPGYAPIARICRPCQDRMYSLYGKWCLDCPTGGNCTALHRSSDGLPRGVGEPRALPGFWLYTAPVKAMLNRCPSDWLDGQEHCNPSELLQIETGICIDREWPSFQLHMCLTQIIFYRCPRGPASCPGNFSMSQVLLGDNYTSGEFDPQCNVGYSNVICGNCLLGYYPAVADECTKCLNSEGEEVQTKMFYGGLMMFMVLLLGVFIFYYLMDGILVGKKWAPHTGPMSCCQKCRKGCRHKVTEGMSQGFQIEKFKIALGLFQVFSR